MLNSPVEKISLLGTLSSTKILIKCSVSLQIIFSPHDLLTVSLPPVTASVKLVFSTGFLEFSARFCHFPPGCAFFAPGCGFFHWVVSTFSRGYVDMQ